VRSRRRLVSELSIVGQGRHREKGDIDRISDRL
jgi:hypothetical protein